MNKESHAVKIRDRIKGLRRVPAHQLVPHPSNWRQHPLNQRNAMDAMLSQIGYAGALICRETDAGQLQILDGHLRALISQDEEVPVLVVDLTDTEAETLLAAFDPIGSLAATDWNKLEYLLEKIQTTDTRLDKVLAEVFSAADEPIQLPEAPESVQDNINKMEEIKSIRRKASQDNEDREDSERYIVIVFPDRQSRERALASIGIAKNERYIAASQIELRPVLARRSNGTTFADGQSHHVAPSRHAGGG